MPTEIPHVPSIYRGYFLWFEPLAAFNGAFLVAFNPTMFLESMSPTAVYAPSNQVVYDQLAGTYVLFAFNQAVVMRVNKDLKVWKAMILGILICDFIHLWAGWRALGSEMFFNPLLWRWQDWINYTSLYFPIVLRICFLKEVGFRKAGTKKDK